MKLYEITDEYINYLRKFDNKVYDVSYIKNVQSIKNKIGSYRGDK